MMPATGLLSLHTRRNRLRLGLWLLALGFCAAFCGRQLLAGNPFHSNLLELLPRDERNPIVHDLSMLLANRFQEDFQRVQHSCHAPSNEAIFRNVQTFYYAKE